MTYCRPTMAEIEVRDPERAVRIRAYDRVRQKKNLADPVRADKIRAHDREREKFRDRPRMAEIIILDPGKAEQIRKYGRDKLRRLRSVSINRAKFMWLGVRAEAKRKGVEFDLTIEWFEARLKAGICEFSGIGFDLERGGTKRARPNAPSIDRIIPGGHYTEANCRMVLFSINVALGNWGEDYVLNVFRHVLARREG